MKYEITKGSDKYFEGAPDWATMAVVFDRAGGRRGIDFSDGMSEGARVFYSHSKKETTIMFTCNWEIIAERRPITEPVWSGEGLPPVGTKCECDSAGDWQECTVILSVDNAIVWQWDWQKPNNACISYAHCAPNFRPIRSPEAVARDEAVAAMFYKVPKDKVAGKDLREAIYDAIAAGEIPGVKLE